MCLQNNIYMMIKNYNNNMNFFNRNLQVEKLTLT